MEEQWSTAGRNHAQIPHPPRIGWLKGRENCGLAECPFGSTRPSLGTSYEFGFHNRRRVRLLAPLSDEIDRYTIQG